MVAYRSFYSFLGPEFGHGRLDQALDILDILTVAFYTINISSPQVNLDNDISISNIIKHEISIPLIYYRIIS